MTLRAMDLTFGYTADRPVLRDTTLAVSAGVVTGLFGPNGSGKSTLLRLMNGVLKPQRGCVLLGDRRIDAMSPRQIAREIAVIPQEHPTAVPLTAAGMVTLGRYAHLDSWGQESPEDRRIVEESLARVDILDLADRFYDQLSGGERQRVIIARALAQQGRVLLLDEPAAHLDIAHQLELYHLVRDLARGGQAVLMVCHDLLVAPLFVDHAVLLASGGIRAVGDVADVLAADNIASVYGSRVDIRWAGSSVSATFT